jgi:hypothetical protein
MAGGRRQEAGGRSQESGGRRQEAGGRRQEAAFFLPTSLFPQHPTPNPTSLISIVNFIVNFIFN